MKRKTSLAIGLSLTIPILAYRVMTFGTLGPGSYRTPEERSWQFTNQGIELALVIFKIDHSRFPTTEEGLAVLAKETIIDSVSFGPYIEAVPLDPWQREYQYRAPSIYSDMGYDLYSFAADGIESDDDVGNWTPDPRP